MEKIKCLWCNALKDKNELNVIYGKNAYFNKSIFYGCGDNNHIEKIKKFLEHTEKYYSHSQSSIKMSLILYPLLMVIFKSMIYWIAILLTIDFSVGLFFFPFGSSNIAEKIGIKNNILFLRSIATIFFTLAIIMILRYFLNKP